MKKSLSSFKYTDENQSVADLLRDISWSDENAQNVASITYDLITKARAERKQSGEIEAFLREYGLETEEGIALMTLAEALLRIPDAATANALIKDKITQASWSLSKSKNLLLMATSLGLNITKKTLTSLIARMGEPIIRQAVIHAMKMMGRQFVLGRTIEEAMKNGQPFKSDGYFMSYDMLGEGARTHSDADKYYQNYEGALIALTKTPQDAGTGLSVKLSALYPRYEYAHKDVCIPVLTEKLLRLCHIAATHDLRITVDAEEADRLDMSIEIITAVMKDKTVQNWAKNVRGFGLAVQAYQKRAIHLVDLLVKISRDMNCPLHVRLVKGAYWDTEIKEAQVLGLDDYPVFTRKDNTDLSYLVCAQHLLKNRDVIYPMFGTHNAQTIASILEFCGDVRDDFEFQRLHGMGENLYAQVLKEYQVNISLYAPVGRHDHLLAYLVRRLLENGANSSFVHKIYDETIPVEHLTQDYIKSIRTHENHQHSKIPLPCDIYGKRLNSQGYDLHDDVSVDRILSSIKKPKITPYVNASSATIVQAFDNTKSAFLPWTNTYAKERSKTLLKLADLIEEHTGKFLSLCIYEAGKTIPDAIAEVREAVDFCRYYAEQGLKDFDRTGYEMPSPTGEHNRLTLEGRGVFVCISPWNFPLAIFIGQVSAALMAGNTVIAKPAEQTPEIAKLAVELMVEAGVPKDAIQLVIGDGAVGAQIIEHPDVAGVAFTGSTSVAKSINRALANKDGAIVPLIAETGGQNAMIVDSTALPEQVVDDVIVSAFGSAGQRCSALRVLCLQDNVANGIIDMIKGAMDTLVIGNPEALSTDVGPVVDQDAKDHLLRCMSKIDGTQIKTLQIPENLNGSFIAPSCYEITSLDALKDEIFGPVLHIYRYKENQRDQLIEQINQLGFGLTFGLHSRIQGRLERDSRSIQAGNIYINRSTIGAVVGVQPFGGRGLSGTGPKAGGPFYLHRFATEKTVTTNTTASGGNTHLISLEE